MHGVLKNCSKQFLLLMLGLWMSGCASVLTPDKQYLSIDTGHVEGARCSVVDDQARQWFVESTPGSIVMERGGTSITIACSHPNYQTAVRQVDGRYSPLLILNIWPFFSEIAGATGSGAGTVRYLVQGGLTVLGMAVDVSQGKHVTLPQEVSIPLVRPTTAIDEGSPGPLSPRTVSPSEESQRLLESEQGTPLSPFDELILEDGG